MSQQQSGKEGVARGAASAVTGEGKQTNTGKVDPSVVRHTFCAMQSFAQTALQM